MTNWLMRWVISGIALAIVAKLHIGVDYSDISSLAKATIVIGLVNSLIKPILTVLTMPLSCMRLGMFGAVLNAVLFYATQLLVPGFKVEFWPGAVLGPMLMSIIGGILSNLLPDRKK